MLLSLIIRLSQFDGKFFTWNCPDFIPEVSSDDPRVVPVPLTQHGPMFKENLFGVLISIPQALAIISGATPASRTRLKSVKLETVITT
jgi:hypothetical protein